MTTSAWWWFCTLCLATAFSPGPAVLLAVSNTATQGARRALLGSAGNATGVFLVALAALLGLGALLRTSATGFAILKMAGAAYLVYLGVRQWRAPSMLVTMPAPGPVSRDACQLYAQGLMVAVTNPKSILFFTALLPQFMHQATSPWLQGLLLTSTFAACTVASHLCYVLAAGRLRRWLAGRWGRYWQRATGALFVGMGIALLRMRRPAL